MNEELFPFILEVEDQRDWQRKPGCFRNPFSCFFCHLLNILEVKAVLDLTYGRGLFYEKCPNLDITGVDIVKWDWVVEPRQFYKMDALAFIEGFNGKADAIVLDPPYPVKPTGRRNDMLYFGDMPIHVIERIIKASKAKARYVILKYMPANNEEYVRLLSLNPAYVITWRFIVTHILNNSNKIIRNSTKILIYTGGLHE